MCNQNNNNDITGIGSFLNSLLTATGTLKCLVFFCSHSHRDLTDHGRHRDEKEKEFYGCYRVQNAIMLGVGISNIIPSRKIQEVEKGWSFK